MLWFCPGIVIKNGWKWPGYYQQDEWHSQYTFLDNVPVYSLGEKRIFVSVAKPTDMYRNLI